MAACLHRQLGAAECDGAPRLPSPPENNFASKSEILNWINSSLQLRLERVEDVSGWRQAAAAGGSGGQAGEPVALLCA